MELDSAETLMNNSKLDDEFKIILSGLVDPAEFPTVEEEHKDSIRTMFASQPYGLAQPSVLTDEMEEMEISEDS